MPDGIRVRFLGSEAPWVSNRLLARIQSWIRYLDFNAKVLAAALAWHDEEPADLVHQPIYATWRVPSRLWMMPVPFVWGPLGGAAMIPAQFRRMLSTAALAVERIRDLQSRWTVRSTAFRKCIERSSVVVAANEESHGFLSRFRSPDRMVRLPSAFLPVDRIRRFSVGESPDDEGGQLELFAGGNIEGRKGVDLAIRALAKVRDAGVRFHYTIAGGGPEIPKLRKLVRSLELDDRVTFHPGFQGEEYVAKLSSADIYLVPSFRETTPVTLQEATLAGCYPIVADASAAGEMVRLVGGSAVPVESPEQVIEDLANEVVRVADDRERMREVAAEASRRVAEHYSADNYDRVIDRAYAMAVEAGPWQGRRD